MNRATGFAGWLALILGWTAIAGAATPVENPHGDFQADCRVCHAPDSWTPAVIGDDFDHSAFGYVLDGAHDGTPCLLCHVSLEFSEVSGTSCAECHQDVHAGELGSDCARCHSTRSFIDRNDEVRSHRMTRFPLTGAHVTADCAQCHASGGPSALSFVNTPTDCAACHLPEYQATVNPNHAAAGFPTDCAQCHSARSWGGSEFDHGITGFPLTGAHRTTDCQACHAGFQFANTPSDCFSCHRGAYAATTNPDHLAGGFPTDCASCHSTSGWAPALFDHALTSFPLTGAHVSADCMACHGDGVYSGKDPACVACHLGEYQATTQPDHLATGFSTDCASCHDTNGWEGARFDHDGAFFPIYSGKHREVWGTDCTTCHTQPSNYAVFACINCHDHARTQTDNDHSEVNGYSYDSNACLSCHPRGDK